MIQQEGLSTDVDCLRLFFNRYETWKLLLKPPWKLSLRPLSPFTTTAAAWEVIQSLKVESASNQIQKFKINLKETKSRIS